MTRSIQSRPCIGILREVKNKWERRVPLIPTHVRELVDSGVRTLIQSSDKRVFTDDEYRLAGATVTDNLSPASIILGIKEFPESSLIPEKTYLMFSHVIKAQPENMGFLDACLRKNIRLCDYEGIRDPKGKRMVAFGRYAGNAGMIDTFRGLGHRLLSLGYSTPFMSVGSSYMYPSLEKAKQAVMDVGEEIKRIGTPLPLGPLTFALTGSGNVSKGAQEILTLLPHKIISIAQLQTLKNDVTLFDNNRVYIVVPNISEIVQPANKTRYFDRNEYYDSPHRYKSIFHENILPYINVLVNGIYWDKRFPQLITKQQFSDVTKTHSYAERQPLIFVADISCDLAGSIEFVEKITTIDKPYFRYDEKLQESSNDLDGPGCFVLAVDNLPAEFPKESSTHFSSNLCAMVQNVSRAKNGRLDTILPAIANACITDEGKLTPNYTYIDKLRKLSPTNISQHDSTNECDLLIRGHLFDTCLINNLLDVVEKSKGNFEVKKVDVTPNEGEIRHKSNISLLISAVDKIELIEIIAKMKMLIKGTPKAQAGMKVSKIKASAQRESTASAESNSDSAVSRCVDGKKVCRILVLGSGFVVSPLVDYLCESSSYEVTIASQDLTQANKIVERSLQRSSTLGAACAVELDASEPDNLSSLIKPFDIVVSLLPANFHAIVATQCIKHARNLVTASYVSPELFAMDDAARNAGILIMNEVGLDPGLDHMVAMKLIDKAHSLGHCVTKFESYCGGLPAPQYADNPFGYKFSWSPIGVLKASSNAALYRKHGEEISVSGDNLLSAAKTLQLPSRALNVEHLPNRDSIVYAKDYGIDKEAETFYRATLRYSGFSALMLSLKTVGVLSSSKISTNHNWLEVIALSLNLPSETSRLQVENVLSQKLDEKFGEVERKRCIDALRFLGVLSDTPESIQTHGGDMSFLTAFCKLLEDKLAYASDESDFVIQHHVLGTTSHCGSNKEVITSSLMVQGDNEYSAMAKTVGLTAAITTKIIAEGGLSTMKGVHKPLMRSLYEPLLDEIATRGIRFIDHITKHQ